MGLLDKLRQFAESKVNQDEIDENSLNDNFDINEYNISQENIESSDEDLSSLGTTVDELIETRQGHLESQDIEHLHELAESYRISIEEMDSMLKNRLDEIQTAIDAGYSPRDVYRTRSIWRRCPNCGWLNYADDVYCEWCGYQLRYKVASFLLGSLISAGAQGGDPNRLHKSHVKNSVSKGKKGKQALKNGKVVKKTTSSKGTKSTLNSNTINKPTSSKKSLFGGAKASATSAPKKSLFGGSASTDKTTGKRSLFSGSTPKTAAKKSSLFGSSKSSSKSSSLLGGGSSKKEKTKKSSLLGGGSSRSSKSKSSFKLGGGSLGRKRR